MSPQVIERAYTIEEQHELTRILSAMPTRTWRWMLGAGNAFVMWAALMLATVIVWLLLAWIARKLFALDFGWSSFAAPWTIGISTPLVAFIAIISSIRWVRKWKDPAPALRQDISIGKALEEHYQFTEAKRFQEPEHGGLLYFLRTADDRAMALFDHESQDLGVHGQDPLTSSFAPLTNLVIVRAPRTRFVLGKHFSGARLEVGTRIELTARPSEWPEPDECCTYGWHELESRLANPKR